MTLILLTGVIEDGGPRGVGVPDDARTTLRLARRAAATVTLTVVDSGGAQYDLTDKACVLTVREASDWDGFILKKTVTDGGEAGVVSFSIAPADTAQVEPGRYVYDVWVDDEPVVGLSAFLLEPSTRT